MFSGMDAASCDAILVDLHSLIRIRYPNTEEWFYSGFELGVCGLVNAGSVFVWTVAI
ncbi:hypothetical protein IQ06DRAFT_73524 [Phaeosphaeriaceae sp. SRC1lsM3a]|nr:hypothetical protein IQ06DRAFT_73524 [Stagonospora sp. SRC1lsM3a]